MPGRTDNEIKNVWNTHLKKRLSPTTKVILDDFGDEPKESSSTTSSSSFSSSSSLVSSNQTQNIETEQLNKTNSINNNNNLFCLKPKATSSLSTNTSNSNSSWPQNHSDFGEEVEKNKENQQLELELESESQSNTMEIEIPLEFDKDFWNMLDLDIDLFESNEVDQNYCQGSNFGAQKNQDFENHMWFKYLENELGLNRPPEPDGRAGVDDTTTEDHRLEDDVDPCMAYFADGFTQQL